MDIVALNIQRAREHGIPDYNTMRGYCGLGKAETFDDLSDEIVPNVMHTYIINLNVNSVIVYIVYCIGAGQFEEGV